MTYTINCKLMISSNSRGKLYHSQDSKVADYKTYMGRLDNAKRLVGQNRDDQLSHKNYLQDNLFFFSSDLPLALLQLKASPRVIITMIVTSTLVTISTPSPKKCLEAGSITTSTVTTPPTGEEQVQWLPGRSTDILATSRGHYTTIC